MTWENDPCDFMCYYPATLASKAEDPNYIQVRGHVQKRIARRFKAICSERGIDFGQGMEEAFLPWIEQQEKLLREEELDSKDQPQS